MHAKAHIKAQANKGSIKCGAANSALRKETTQDVEINQGRNEGGMKSLEVYFDNLAAAVVSKKLFLDKQVANNTNLTTTNKNLVAVVKN